MRIAVIGANGAIGSRVVAEALDRGHEVTAVLRDRGRADTLPDGIQIAVADATDTDEVAAAIGGHDAVVSAVGGGSSGRPEVVVEVARALIAAMPKAGTSRLGIVGGAGSLEDAHGVQLVESPDFPPEWKPGSLAQRQALTVFREDADELEWSYLSPADVIEPGVRTGSFSLGRDRVVVGADGSSRISTEDYACALIDELEWGAHVRQRFTVGYR